MIDYPNPKDPRGFVEYTQRHWNALEGFYGFWANRWNRVLDFLRSVHWRIGELGGDPANEGRRSIPRWKSFAQVNISLALYQDFLSQWLQTRVRYSAIPESAEPADIAAAELADQVLQYLWDSTEMERKRVDLGAWLIATGNAVLRVYWKTFTGKTMPLMAEENGQLVPIDPVTGLPDPSRPSPAEVDIGDVDVEVIPPYLCRYPYPDRDDVVMVGFYKTREEVSALWGADIASKLSYSSTPLYAVGGLQGSFTAPTVQTALLVEHYLPPSERFPQGLWWTSSGNILVLEPSELPTRYPPVVHFRWIPLPGHATMGVSPLYDITFLNKAMDKALARSQEWLSKVVPKIIRQDGDGISPGELDSDEPFQEVVVSPNMKPDVLEIPQPPPLLSEIREEALRNALFLGGYTLRRPKETPPGETVNRLRLPPRTLNEGEVVSLAVINSKFSWQRLGYILLDYVAKFYTEPRALSLIGPDGVYRWKTFFGDSLRDKRLRLRIEELPLYTWNRQSVRDYILGLLTTGAGAAIFSAPEGGIDRKKLSLAFEVAGIDLPFDSLDPDVVAARNENYFVMQGKDIGQANPWDDHAKHLAEHLTEVKSLRFAAQSEEVRQIFLRHIASHEEALAERQQKEASAMLEREVEMRRVRAETEAARVARSELAAMIVNVLREVFLDILKGGKDDRSNKA